MPLIRYLVDGGNKPLMLPVITLADGRRINHVGGPTADGRLVGSLLRTDICSLERRESGPGYYAERIDYTVSERHTMRFDEESVAYMKVNNRGLDLAGFNYVNPEQIEENARRMLILGSGLPEAILRFANEFRSPRVIRVSDNRPLAEAIRATVTKKPGLRGNAEIIFVSQYAERI